MFPSLTARFYRIAAAAVIGALVGGLGMGLANLHRADPRASLASNESFPPECQATVQQYVDYVELVNSIPRPIPEQEWNGHVAETERLLENVYGCLRAICGPLWTAYEDAERDLLNARMDRQQAEFEFTEAVDAALEYQESVVGPTQAEHDEAADELSQYRSALPIEPTQEQLDELARLEAEVDRLRTLLDEEINPQMQYLREVTEDLADRVQDLREVEEDLQAVFNDARDRYDESNCEETTEWERPELDPNTEPGTGYGYGYGSGGGASSSVSESLGVPAAAKY